MVNLCRAVDLQGTSWKLPSPDRKPFMTSVLASASVPSRTSMAEKTAVVSLSTRSKAAAAEFPEDKAEGNVMNDRRSAVFRRWAF